MRIIKIELVGAVRLLLLLVTMVIQNVKCDTEKCGPVHSRCMTRLGCRTALQNYLMGCAKLTYGERDDCYPECRMALVSILSTEDGENIMNCDCDGNEYCDTQKTRTSVCSEDVLHAMRNVYDAHTQISCSLAELVCEADTTCFTALEFYRQHCTKLFRGERCTSACNNSLNILYRQAAATKLRNCLCDGTENYNCPQLRRNSEVMCFGRVPTQSPPTSTSTSTQPPHVRHHDSHNHTRPPHRHHNHTETPTVPPCRHENCRYGNDDGTNTVDLTHKDSPHQESHLSGSATRKHSGSVSFYALNVLICVFMCFDIIVR